LPADHPKVGRDLANLGSLGHADGNSVLAARRFERAIEILPTSSPDASSARLGYARLLIDSGEGARAERYAREALELRRETLPDGHGLIGEAELVLGQATASPGPRQAAHH
jgi:hypothetical protein